MGRKRRRLETWGHLSEPLYESVLEELAAKQDSGAVYYGDFIYNKEQRTRRSYETSVNIIAKIHKGPGKPPAQASPPITSPAVPVSTSGLPSVQEPVDSRTVRGNGDGEFLEEENALIIKAKNLGKSWPEITRMLSGGRTVTMVRKHYTMNLKPQAPPSKKKPSVPRPEESSARAASEAPSGVEPPQQQGAASMNLHQISAAIQAKAASNKEKEKEKTKQVPAAARQSSEPGNEETGLVDHRCTERAGGDARVTLAKPMEQPLSGFTGRKAHGLKNLEGVSFFGEISVVDPDDPRKSYKFDLSDRVHGACFNIGMGPDRTPLISWSDLYNFYQLPDGTKWAEHGCLFDREDLENHAKKVGKDAGKLVGGSKAKQELFKLRGRFHSRLQNIEYEFWTFRDKLPSEEELRRRGVQVGDAYFWKVAFDPHTLEKVSAE